MAEPASTALTGAAAAGSVISVVGGIIHVAGIATGIPPELILPAFVGSLVGLRKADPGGTAARVAQVCVSTLLATWGAAVVVAMAAGLLPVVFAQLDPVVSRYPAAFGLGWGGLRLVLPWIERHFGGLAAEERQP